MPTRVCLVQTGADKFDSVQSAVIVRQHGFTHPELQIGNPGLRTVQLY